MRKKIYLMRPSLDNTEIRYVKQVFKSKHLTEGKITKKFESSISKYVKAKYAIATTSATTALHTVFESLNIKGKKILVSDFTFPATANAIILAGGIPVLVDVNKETMNVSREIVENSISSNSQFVVPVSIFGNPLEREFYNIKKHGIIIVEDAATTLGAKIGHKFVGSLADISCFSFHPRKIITTGEGGMITTNNKVLAEKCRTFKTFGAKNEQFVNQGTNYKLSDILSAVGIAQLKKIEPIIKKRSEKAKIYDEILSKINYVEFQKSNKNSRHTHQSYTIIIKKSRFRDKIRKKLNQNNVETQIGTYALHCLPAFKNSLRKGKLENSEFLFKNCITLPLHEELTLNDQDFICKIIKKTL